MQGTKSFLQLVTEYGFVTAFAVIVTACGLWLGWLLIKKLFIGENSFFERWLKGHLKFLETTSDTMNEIKIAVSQGEGVAQSIDATLKEHTSILKHDGVVLRDVKQATDRMERKIEQVHT